MHRIRFSLKRLWIALSRQFPVFNLRIPDDLKDRVVQSAKANKRSQNAEYLYRLEGSFQQDDLLKRVLEELQSLRQEVEELKSPSSDSDE